MDSSLQNLLNFVADKKTSKTKSYGLTDMNAPSNLWVFKDDNKQATFWIKYCDMVQNQKYDSSKSYNYFLGEVSEESAFIVELIFRFMDSEKIRHEDGPFNEEFICDIIGCINRILETHLVISEDKKELICCVLQSKKVMNDILTPDEVKYTLRLHYPLCRTKVSTQKQVLRDLIIKELHARGPTLDQSALGDWKDRYDSSIPTSYVPLFGSKRKAMDELLELTYIFGSEKDEYGLLTDIELKDVFNPRLHSDVQTNRIDKEIFDDDDNLEKWLPLFFSPTYWPSVCKMLVRQEIVPSTSQDNIREQAAASDEPKSSSDFLKIFVRMLKDERKNDLNVWMDVGKAYYNATKGTIDGLNSWKEYTKDSTKFSLDMCEIKYPLFRDSFITHKTIAWHAIKDSPDKYKEWHNKWINDSMKKAIDEPLHTAIAEMFYRKHWLHFAYSSNGKLGGGKTYRFDKDGHRWRQLEDGELIIGKILTDKFLHRFEKEKININREILQLEDSNLEQKKKSRKTTDRRNSKEEESDEKTKLEQSYKNVLKIIAMLGSTPQKKCVFKGVQEKLFIEGFDRNLDTNPMLVGVVNGVIEVDTKDARFRPGKPEDYLSMFTSLPYREDFNMECDAVKRYLKYLNQVFPNKELMQYMRKDISSFLKGRNAEKLFRIFSGCGNNSKSVYIKLLERAFGSYCVSIPVSVITVKRGSASSASPETARLKGTHIATCAEPDDNETIKAGRVKEMTGNDRFFTRALFSNGEEIEAMYKLILITNKVPSIPNAGVAIKNRVIIVPFLAKFANKDYPEDEEEQYRQRTFKMDPDFDDYVPLLSQAMLWCAVQDYRTYCQEGLKDFPNVIMDETLSYWEENDPYDLFIKEKLIREVLPEDSRSPEIPDIILENPVSEDKKEEDVPIVRQTNRKSTKKEQKYTTELLFSDLNRVFKMWVKEAFPGLIPGNQEQIRKEFEAKERLGPQTANRKWAGWSLKEEDKNRI